MASGALAQESGSTASTTATQPAAASTEPSRRGRDRRRNAEAATASAAPALAAAATVATAAATNQASTVETEVVCKNIKPIGSRIPRRVCATEAQWSGASERTAGSAQEEMRQIRDRAGLTGPAPAGPASLSLPSRF